MENWRKLSLNYHQISTLYVPLEAWLIILWVAKNPKLLLGDSDNKDQIVRFLKVGLSLCCMHVSHAMRKCVFGSLRPGKTQTDLFSYRHQLESWNFGYINKRYHSVLAANNKGADQSARMRRLICAFVVRRLHKTHFLMAWLMSFHRGSFTVQIRKIWTL